MPSNEPYADFLIKEAIRNRWQVFAYYNGRYRVFCPHTFGTKGGSKRVLGYQFDGTSETNALPEWRCFLLSGLSGVGAVPGRFHTGDSHTRPQTCIDDIELVIDY